VFRFYAEARVDCDLMVLTCPAFAKRKDDVVVMKNGDRFTGEVKGLQAWEADFQSAYHDRPSSPGLEAVDRLESKGYLYRLAECGARVTGTIGGWRCVIRGEFQIVATNSQSGVNRPK